jgi:hypothetical protein
MLAQAKAMEINARSMVAEAARMKKDAERMDPTVSARAIAPNVQSMPQLRKRLNVAAVVLTNQRLRWLMQHNDDFLTQWEHILADVNKTDVPLECIKKVVIKLAGGKQKTINVHTLLKQGLELAEVEQMLTRFFSENDHKFAMWTL